MTATQAIPEQARAHIRLGLALLNYLALPGQPLSESQRGMVQALGETLYWQGKHDGLLDAMTSVRVETGPHVTDESLGVD